MTPPMALIGSPVVLGLLVRLLRRPQGALTELVRNARDLITLRMMLRDSEPNERGDLLDAHRGWRIEPTRPPRPGLIRPVVQRGPLGRDVGEACDAIMNMIDFAKPRNAALMRLTTAGYTQGEIADRLHLEVGDVENARYRFRQKVRRAVCFGDLQVPAEWRTSKLLAEKVSKG